VTNQILITCAEWKGASVCIQSRKYGNIIFLLSRSPVVVEQSDDLQGAIYRPADVLPAIDDRLVTDREPSVDNARRSEFPASSLLSSQVSPSFRIIRRELQNMPYLFFP
jgi:hypothetical protein